MCTYSGDDPDHLAECLDSLARQSLPADEIVLVCDGPLTGELDAVLRDYSKRMNTLKTVRCEQNQGLIAALNHGLQHCSGDVVLRMDSDDVAHEHRFRTQVAYLAQHDNVDVLGTAILEFTDNDINKGRLKPVPVEQVNILRQMPWRNPINHPTVAFRRSVLKLTGGYPELRYLEDYFLWAQLAAAGVQMANLEAPLVFYRFDDGTLKRRGGWLNLRHETYLRWWMYRHGLADFPTMFAAVTAQLILRLSPVMIRRWLWRRSRVSTGDVDRVDTPR